MDINRREKKTSTIKLNDSFHNKPLYAADDELQELLFSRDDENNENRDMLLLRNAYNAARTRSSELVNLNIPIPLRLQSQQASRVFSSIAALLFAHVIIAKSPEIEKFIKIKGSQLPRAVIDLKDWEDIIKLARDFRETESIPHKAVFDLQQSTDLRLWIAAQSAKRAKDDLSEAKSELEQHVTLIRKEMIDFMTKIPPAIIAYEQKISHQARSLLIETDNMKESISKYECDISVLSLKVDTLESNLSAANDSITQHQAENQELLKYIDQQNVELDYLKNTCVTPQENAQLMGSLLSAIEVAQLQAISSLSESLSVSRYQALITVRQELKHSSDDIVLVTAADIVSRCGIVDNAYQHHYDIMVDVKDHNIADLNQQISSLHDECSHLQDEINTNERFYNINKMEMTVKVSEMESMISSLTSSLKSSEDNHSQAISSNQTIIKKLHQAENDKMDLQSKVEEYQVEINQFKASHVSESQRHKEEISSLQAIINSLDSINQELKDQVTSFQSSSTSSVHNLEMMNRELSSQLASAHDISQATINKLEASNRELSSQLQAAQLNFHTTTNSPDACNQVLVAKLAAVEASSKSTIDELTSQLATLQAKFTTLETSNIELKSQVSAAQSNPEVIINKLEAGINDISSKLTVSHTESQSSDALQAIINKVEANNIELTSQLTAAQAISQATINNLEAAKLELTSQLSTILATSQATIHQIESKAKENVERLEDEIMQLKLIIMNTQSNQISGDIKEPAAMSPTQDSIAPLLDNQHDDGSANDYYMSDDSASLTTLQPIYASPDAQGIIEVPNRIFDELASEKTKNISLMETIRQYQAQLQLMTPRVIPNDILFNSATSHCDDDMVDPMIVEDVTAEAMKNALMMTDSMIRSSSMITVRLSDYKDITGPRRDSIPQLPIAGLQTPSSNHMLEMSTNLNEFSELSDDIMQHQPSSNDKSDMIIPISEHDQHDGIIKVQAMVRGFLERSRIRDILLQQAAQEKGILVAYPGTKQGDAGWYIEGESLYYFCLDHDEFALLCGPIPEPMFNHAIRELHHHAGIMRDNSNLSSTFFIQDIMIDHVVKQVIHMQVASLSEEIRARDHELQRIRDNHDVGSVRHDYEEHIQVLEKQVDEYKQIIASSSKINNTVPAPIITDNIDAIQADKVGVDITSESVDKVDDNHDIHATSNSIAVNTTPGVLGDSKNSYNYPLVSANVFFSDSPTANIMMDEQTLGSVVKVQALTRGFLARSKVDNDRLASSAQESGVLVALKNTEQGESGWYTSPNGIYYFVQDDGNWILAAGPITQQEYDKTRNNMKFATRTTSFSQLNHMNSRITLNRMDTGHSTGHNIGTDMQFLVRCPFPLAIEHDDVKGDIFMSTHSERLFIAVSVDDLIISSQISGSSVNESVVHE